jgi:hypothetical protein
LKEDIQEKLLNAIASRDDLLVPAFRVGPDGRQFQSVQRALARQRFATVPFPHPFLPQRILFAHQHRQQWIVTQLIVIVEVFVAQREAVDALAQQLQHRVFDLLRVTVVDETLGELPNDPCRLFGLPE